MENKYQTLVGDFFGFDIFEDVLTVINVQKGTMDDQNFNAGVASADAAVRRLREKYYRAIKLELELNEQA